MAEVIGVKTNVKELLKKYRIRENKIPRAVKFAINKTGGKLKTDTSKYIRENLAIPKRKVDSRLPTFTANIHKLAYTIRATKKPFHVLEYKNPRQTKLGLTYKHSPKKPRRTIKGGFIATVRETDFRGGFIRKDKAKTSSGRDRYGRLKKNRLPIRKLVRSGVNDVVKDKGYKTRMKQLAGKDFPEQLTKQLKRFMD